MYGTLRKLAFVFVLLLSASVAMGQVAMGTNGTYPLGTFDTLGFDTVNVGNLNVHFNLPILNKAGRGTPFQYSLGFDSSIWFSAPQAPTYGLGWTSYSGSVASSNNAYNPVNEFFEYGSSMSAQTPLLPYGEEVVPYSFRSQLDNNGNSFLMTVAWNPAGAIYQYYDTTGNVVLTISMAIAINTSYTYATYTYKDTNGTSQTVTARYKQYTVQTAFGCSGIAEAAPAIFALPDTITYPDGGTYHLSYEATPGHSGNVTGRIAGVTLPQGGSISYTYTGGSNGIECADGGTAGLTRTLNSDSGSAVSTRTYSRTITGTGTSQTAVVDGLGNSKVYNFVEADASDPTYDGLKSYFYETGRSIFQGAASGTPVITRNICYNGSALPCTTTALTLPISQIDTYETQDGVQTHGSTALIDANGSPTEADNYDFGGTSARGPLLSKESWTYGVVTANLGTELVTEADAYDGSGNLTGKTQYRYDENAPAVSSGVPSFYPQQSLLNSSGNLTTKKQYASATTWDQTTYSYEDTGSLLTSTSPNGATTTYSYDSIFVYNTGISLPTPSSGVALGMGETFDTANTGLPLSATDANGQPTHISSHDSMLRPTEVDSPDGGKTTYSYSPTQTGQHTYQSAAVFSDTETQYDGYGRVSRVAVANGQSGNSWYLTDTCYDGNGNVSFKSYPYQEAGFGAAKICSGAGDTYTYDVLGRVTSMVRANGETSSSSYLGRAKKSVDENGVTRISQVDGLGRKTIVCEVSSNSSMPSSGSPAGCGTDIAGTGFTTNYSYDLVNHKTTITQGAQTRVFQTDWLGRTTLVQEPESGTATYTYAYNGTGLQITRQRPTANQSNPTILTTTTTQFDFLGRVVSISYNDGTPTKTFAYDKSANWLSFSQVNLKGRLSAESISGAGTAFSYDPVGRTADLHEALPSGGGNGIYDKPLHYSYDWAGNLLTSTDGAGVASSYTVSPANEILSLTSSLSNATDPANILSNVQNGPSGPASYSLGNGLSGAYGYDGLGRPNGGWVCNGSPSAGCTGGTQVYGFTNTWDGTQLSGSSDSALDQESSYGYDEFNRLTSRTVSGVPQNFTYVYDRYGNRWTQNVTAGSGPSPQLSFNTATNQMSTYSYDAAGNMLHDGLHSYTYDAEGNITAVDGGTATYVYNALNQRVRSVVGGVATEFVFNAAGQRVSEWNGTTQLPLKGRYFWGGKPVAYYTTTASSAGAAAHFEHQDWLGTERMRTTYNGSVEGSSTSLPFGDAQASSGSDTDSSHFAMLDDDAESGTGHAQFRQLSYIQGRWLSPDPYSGSYDLSNPQSLNRYAYVVNNPLAMVDPLGWDGDSPCAGYYHDQYGNNYYWDGTTLYAYTPQSVTVTDGDPMGAFLLYDSTQSDPATQVDPPPQTNDPGNQPQNQQTKTKPWYCGSGNSWSHPLTAPTSKQWNTWATSDALFAAGIAKYTKGSDIVSEDLFFSGLIEAYAGAKCGD